jgi:O-antigen/teichoic acid export membrane protein
MTAPAARSTSRAVVARGVSWIAAGHVVRQLAWFGSLLLVATLVAPRAFGSVAAAMVVVQVAWLVVNSGTRGALVVGRTVTAEQVRRAMGVNLATGTVIACAAILLSSSVLPIVVPGADPMVLQALGTTIMLNGLSIVPLALLQRELRFRQHAAANAGAALGASVGCAVAAMAGAGVWALVIRQVLFQLLLAGLAWRAVQPLLPGLPRVGGSARRDPLAKWFFATTAIGFATLNVDNVIVGHFTSVRELGLYSLAFTIAFAPMTQFAWQVGTVLQPAAARTTSLDVLGARVCTAVRAASLVLLPAAVPAIALAPAVLPGLIGARWAPMVAPFQLLVLAGIAQGILAIVRQFLVASGSVRFCALVDGGCLLATVGGLLALVRLDGIVGAALAHVAVAGGLLAVYGVLGARRLGSRGGELWAFVRGIVVPVMVQGVVTALWFVALEHAGARGVAAAPAATAVGLLALVVALFAAGTSPLREIRSLFGGRPAPPLGGRAWPLPRLRLRPPLGVPAGWPLGGRRPGVRYGRPRRAVTGVAGASMVAAAVIAGAASAREPRISAGLAVAALALVLSFRAPVAHLLLLIVVTLIVPQSVQARFGSGGSVNAAGILPSDLLLIAALVRALVVLPRRPLPLSARWAAALMVAFLAAAAVQVVHALQLGRPLSGVGGEFRVLLAFGALLAALPLVADSRSRRRLLTGLPFVGLALGLWGVAQFALGLRFDQPDLGTSVSTFLTAGRVVGLLGFPVAAVLSLAAVTGAPPRAAPARALLLATFATNSLAIVLAFERTIVFVTLIGFALVFVRATAGQRLRMLAWAPPVVGIGLVLVALASPGVLPAFAQRLSTLTALRSDPSVLYRLDESRIVGRQIAAHPLAGSGLGATILIGRPGTNVPLAPRRFAENGYQWLAWKVGLPAAALLWALLALAILVRGGRGEPHADAVLRCGCQTALAVLAIATLTFPSFNDLEVAPAAGLVAALALCRPHRPEVMLWLRAGASRSSCPS